MSNGHGLSLIYPVLNEADILEENLHKTIAFLKSKEIPFEIIVVNNGSSDQTESILKTLSAKYEDLIVINLSIRGLGLAIKAGINSARYNICMFYAIDLPFGFEVITNSLSTFAVGGVDIVIGSKGHVRTQNNAPLKRKVSSYIYNHLLCYILGIKIKDTQGSLLFNKNKILNYLSYCTSNDAFFCTQVILYGNLSGLLIKEIPVNYKVARVNSKIKIIKVGGSMFRQLIVEKNRMKNFRVL